jgi:hypothetical protein
MNTRTIVLIAVLVACFSLAVAVSRAVILRGSPAETPSRMSKAGSLDGVDLKMISSSSPYMRDER